MGCSSSKDELLTEFVVYFPGKVAIIKPQARHNPSPTATCSCSSMSTPASFLDSSPICVSGLISDLSAFATPKGFSDQKLKNLQARSVDFSGDDSSDDSFDSCYTGTSTSLDTNMCVVIPDNFSRKYKIMSVISKKSITSFAFRGDMFEINE